MTHAELCAALTASGLAWTGERWGDGEVPRLPYVVKCREGMPTTHADNSTALVEDRWRLELYSRNYDQASEAVLMSALDAAGLAYSCEPVGQVPDSGGVFEVCYYLTTIN